MAPHVLFRDETSGETFKFHLSQDSKLTNVDNVLAAIGWSLVKWRDSAGFVCILEKEENGSKSANVFTPGEMVVFQPSPQELQARGLDHRSLLDLNRAEMGPDIVSEMEDEAFNVAGPDFHTLPELKTNKMRTENTDIVYMLFKKQVDEECFIGNPDQTWEERYTSSEQTAHVDQLNAWLSLRDSSSFRWLKPHQTRLRKVFQTSQRLLSIGSKTDVVLADMSRGVQGAVLGVELVKNLTWRGLFRSQLEFYLWASSSLVPYVQLYTDMVSGGVVHFCVGLQDLGYDVKSHVWMVVLQGKEEVEEFVRGFGQRLPPSIDKFSGDDFEELDNPLRGRYPFPGARVGYTVVQTNL